MTDLETYTYWAANYDAIAKREMVGAITPDEMDRMSRNMQERLGMDKWTEERWQAAYEAWKGEGA